MNGNMNKKVYDKYNCVFMFKLVCSKNSVWSDITMIYKVVGKACFQIFGFYSQGTIYCQKC